MASSSIGLDRSTIRSNLLRFSKEWRETIDQWRENDVKHTEKSYAQPFWSEFLACFGINASRRAFFEQLVTRGSTGTAGYIDLFWAGVVIGEAKSLGRDLALAEDQARDYLTHVSDPAFPRYILCTDFETFRLFHIASKKRLIFSIDELADHQDQLAFLAGREEISHKEQQEASIAASKIMAKLFKAMAGDDVDVRVGDEAPTNPEEEDKQVQLTSMWLTRLLFLMFGDDAGLWEADLFHRFVVQETTPDNFGAQMTALFNVLNTPENKRRYVPGLLAKFPYVNGHLFEDSLNPEFFTVEMHQAVREACGFQWSRISPAIFGSLFQLVKSKEARRGDGEHYTSETNILKVIGPLFLDELRAEADRLVRNKTTTIAQLEAFLDRLTRITFVDPACGCGNFLVVAYRELRRIETDVIARLHEFDSRRAVALDVMFEQKLSIDQFHGFEINWWPVRIAEVAMFLVDHQANRELAQRVGSSIVRLPIEISAHIKHCNALEIDWAEELPDRGETYIFGNPPFIGHQTKTKEQRHDLKLVWQDDFDGYLDYVTAWHAQALRALAQRQGLFAYVTTNSICQGQPVPALFDPIYRQGWDIKFAHRTFAWDSEAPGKAAVHCIVVGFTRDQYNRQRLWDYPDVDDVAEPVELRQRLNAYLVQDNQRTLVRKRSKPLSPEVTPAYFGTMPLGKFLLVEEEEYPEVAADPVASKYLRPFRGSRELVRGKQRWCLWMADDNFDPADINRSSILKSRINACQIWRSEQTTGGDAYKFKDMPHLFRPNSKRPTTNYLCVPSVVSETRKYFTAQRLTAEYITSNAVFNVVDPEGLAFALISSSMFITWQKTVGGRLKSDVRFSSTLVWNNFPVPALDPALRKRIIDAGKGVLEARALHPERSLADAYNPLAMDPELLKAHDKLDRVVDQAFGAARKLNSEAQRLELLFASYAKLIEQEKNKGRG